MEDPLKPSLGLSIAQGLASEHSRLLSGLDLASQSKALQAALGADLTPFKSAAQGLMDSEITQVMRERDDLLKAASIGIAESQMRDLITADVTRHREMMRPWETAIFAMKQDAESQSALMRAAGIFDPSDAIRAFALPDVSEAVKLYDRLKPQESAIAAAMEGFNARLEATRLTIPWLDEFDPMKSVSAFQNLETLSRLATQVDFGDLKTSQWVRDALGDWRDPMTFPTTMDYAARSAVYREQGVDPDLTDFTEDSFDEIVDAVGLAYHDDFSGIAGVPPMDVREIQRNVDAYDRLLRFEIALRGFISEVMRRQFGQKWAMQRTPPSVLQSWRDKREKAVKAGQPTLPLIEYADFMDYHQIISRADNWSDVFIHIFYRVEDIREAFHRMAPTRNADMHARIITPDDLVLITFETQRLISRMRAFTATLH